MATPGLKYANYFDRTGVEATILTFDEYHLSLSKKGTWEIAYVFIVGGITVKIREILCLTLLLLPTPGWGSTVSPKQNPPQYLSAAHQSGEFSSSLAEIVGVSISPLWGVVGVGMYDYFTTSQPRETLPLYSQPVVWGPILVLLLVLLSKTAIGQSWPFAKPFLEAADVVVLRKSGYVLAALPFVIEHLRRGVADQVAVAVQTHLPVTTVYAASASHLAASAAPSAGASLLSMIAAAVILAGSAAIWLLSHTVDIVALLPVPFVDVILRFFRLGVVATLAVLPTVGKLALSVVIMAFAFLFCRWAWRLMVMGTTFALDILLMRWKRTAAVERRAVVFAGPGLPGVSNRTKGHLVCQENGVEFAYRDWLFRRRTCLVPVDAANLGLGFIYHSVMMDKAILLRFPPRYRSQAAHLQAAFGLREVKEVGVRRFWTSVKAWFKPKANVTA